MITELDERKYFHWEAQFFYYDGKTVRLRLQELFVNDEPEDFVIDDNHIIKDVHKIEPNKNSKLYDVIFDDVAFFQAYDELRHIESNNEQFDEGIIRKYVKSNLLDFIENKTRFKTETPEKYFNNLKHYCVRTANDWFDIIGLSDPFIKLLYPK